MNLKFWEKSAFWEKNETDVPAEKTTQIKDSVKHGDMGGNSVDFLFSSFGTGIMNTFLSAQLAYTFYNKISPLQGTVSKIANAIGSLPLAIRDEKQPDTLIKDSEILDLLKNPSPLTTKSQFFTNCAVSMMLTKEMYIVLRGPIGRKPSEMVMIHPYSVQLIGDVANAWPLKIYTNINGDRRYYYRELIQGRYRYIDKMRMNEIFPYISERSDDSTTGYFRGISPLTSMKDELLSYSASILGNTKSIENSGRPSGIIAPKDDELGEEQYDDLKKSIRDQVAGVDNNGNVVVVPARVEAVFPEWAPKDMDYETLQKNVKTNLWNLYSMPFPIVSDTNQTFNNAEIAQISFYDEAVNVNWSIVADALRWALETRYEMKGLMIDYNPLEVPALRRRAINIMKEMRETSSLRINEIRNTGGFEDDPDGENILVSSKDTTLGAVVDGASFTQDNPDDPTE